IDYRNEKGLFKNIEEIQNVSGIGPSTFANIKDLITAGDQNIQSENEEVTVVTQMSSGPTTKYGDGTLYSSVPVSSFKSANKLEIGIGKDRVGVVGSPI
ncbi:helix-hairpin-helix domain-containing protein, partial [Candidatus Wolfebacteria bacterium]|nr:helix-hairpin-helix domain-containing protein [Candidatus Wolfebacteria bacterium]